MTLVRFEQVTGPGLRRPIYVNPADVIIVRTLPANLAGFVQCEPGVADGAFSYVHMRFESRAGYNRLVLIGTVTDVGVALGHARERDGTRGG